MYSGSRPSFRFADGFHDEDSVPLGFYFADAIYVEKVAASINEYLAGL